MSEFWSSEEGILLRLDDLANIFSFKTYNGALKGAFREAGITQLQWTSVIDKETCEHCDAMDGRIYGSSQFLPKMPAHPNCRCLWDVWFE